MSTPSCQADLHRILSREEESRTRHIYAVKAPDVGPDSAYLDHLGAHFPAGSGKGSFPVYPQGVEVSEDEGAVARPDPATTHIRSSYQMQYGHENRQRYYSSSVPAQFLTRDYFSISPEDFVKLQRRRSGGLRYGDGSGKQIALRIFHPPMTNGLPFYTRALTCLLWC